MSRCILINYKLLDHATCHIPHVSMYMYIYIRLGATHSYCSSTYVLNSGVPHIRLGPCDYAPTHLIVPAKIMNPPGQINHQHRPQTEPSPPSPEVKVIINYYY